MKLRKLLPLLFAALLMVTMAFPIAAEAEEDYLWNIYDMNFDEMELDLIRFGFKFKADYASKDGTLKVTGIKYEKDEQGKDKEVADVFYTNFNKDLKKSVVVEVKFKTNSTNVFISNVTNSNTASPGYNLLINRDGDLCLNKSAVKLSKSPVNDEKWHTTRFILENDETVTVFLDGTQVYTGDANASSANENITTGGFGRFNISIVSTKVENAYVEIDYVRIGDGTKGVVEETTEAPETTETPETTESPVTDAGTEGANTTVADGTEAPVVTTEAEGTDAADEKDSSSIGLIIGIAAAVVVVAVVVTVIIKKKK